MKPWRKEIINGDLGERVEREYHKLLSVKKEDEEAERLLAEHIHDKLPDELSVGRFWMMLGLCEWEFGRLTGNAQKQARQWAMYPWDNISKETLQALLNTLESPMPPRKKVRLPSYISHCPWPVGSLLAYRIISSEHPYVVQSSFYGKYVLLRIIQIKKIPVTDLDPTAAWNECMLVGLYDWIGDSIPDPQIINDLRFTAVSIQQPSLSAHILLNSSKILGSAINEQQMQPVMERLTKPRIETCADLNWKCVKPVRLADVFTYLGCDASFGQTVSPFFKTDETDYAMNSNHSFDAVLVNRFTQLAEEAEKSVL